MGLLNKLFQSGAKDLVDSVGNAIDKIHTSSEEKELVKAEIKKKILDYDYNIQKEVTKRWESDNSQDSWLPKNIRPLVLAWLVVSTTLLIFIDAGVIDFVVDDEWKSTLTAILTADVHIGKYADALETGSNYNIKIARERILNGVRGIISKSEGFVIDKVLFCIGNDILHTDNVIGTTTKGTRQDTDGKWHRHFTMALEVYVECVEMLNEYCSS
jgi:hypothetical protein